MNMEKMSEIPTDLSRYNNDWYRPGGFLRRVLWYVAGRLLINTYAPVPNFLKVLLLRGFGARIGSGVVIKPKVLIKYPWFLCVENNTWIGEKVWIDNLTQVRIGKNVCISQGAMLLTGNHNYSKVGFDLIVAPILLEDGVWIGARAVVCPGVVCESHAVLTVASVATRQLKAYGIYQGNPAVWYKNRQISE